jgi:photosystem II stability/assembly factor-like uncharacterized protein
MNGKSSTMSGAFSLSLGTTFLFLFLGAAAFGQPPQVEAGPWTPFGPGGGTSKALAVDPRFDSGKTAVVYAIGTGDFYNLRSSLFKSTDGGATWKDLIPAEIMAIDPEHPSTIYAGGSNLLRSTDGGRTWADISPHFENDYLYLTALAVVPGGVLLAADFSRLLRSVDGGRTWSIVADQFYVQSILVDPADPRRVYSLNDDALFRSDDKGAHWSLAAQPGSPDFNFSASGFALAPSAPKTLYILMSYENHLYRSNDGAATWHRVGKAPPNSGSVLLVDPRSPDTLYAAGDGGVATSTDGGRSWRTIGAGLPRRPDNKPLPVLSLALAPSRPETLFAGTTGWGIARSESSGARWRTGFEAGLSAAYILNLQFHPLRPGTLYLFQNHGRSFRSVDGGRTWQPFARAHARNGLNFLAFDPTDPALLYGTDQAGTWKSADGGETWTWLSPQGGRLAALGHQTLIALDCGLAQSTDEGRTWRKKIPCDTPDGDGGYRVPIAILADPRAPRTAYAQFLVNGDTHPFRNEVFGTQDGGATWTVLALSNPYLFAVAPSDSRIVYAYEDYRLLRSVDGGGSWKTVNGDLPPGAGGSFDGGMAVDPSDPDTLYFAGDQLVISHDGGVTFKAIDAPLAAGKTADRLWTDPAHPGVLYGTSYAGGLFVGRFE